MAFLFPAVRASVLFFGFGVFRSILDEPVMKLLYQVFGVLFDPLIKTPVIFCLEIDRKGTARPLYIGQRFPFL